ncbi:heme lyase CcmF/NrfE family subunit [Segnochrobactraceae bacterium EtOH-i3]
MTIEIGHFALVLALMLSLVQSVVPVIGAQRRDPRMMAVGEPVAIGACLLVALSFAVLTIAYLRSDFSVLNVYENSHSAKPLLFKISGVWGNHEGSMMLWVLILVLFGALVAVFGRGLPATLRANVIGVQGWISATFLLFILTTSNPFTRLVPAPFEGQDLNPILQDVGLAIHPPLLYLGYVGFSITFAFAVAALLDGRIDAAWARWVRPWALTAWLFLTLGIAMGSYWAYYELGWGGFWFWDPVENASFMPWLSGTALIHSAIVMEKRDALKVWTVLLAILTFSLSLLGTFLVRSGVLTSVHAFATDPTRGVAILMILIVFIGGSLGLYAWRAPTLKQGGLFAPISREGAIVFNNLIVTTACATVFVGTLYPMVLEATVGEKISVGAPFYELTFIPLMIPALIAVPVGPLLAWKRGDLLAVAERLSAAAALALAALAVAAWLKGADGILPALAVGLSVWLMAGAVTEPLLRAGVPRQPVRIVLRRLVGLPRSAWGTTIAHAGLGISILGIACASFYGSEQVLAMKTGETTDLAGYHFTFDGITPRQGGTYREEVGHFTVTADGKPITVIQPAKRLYTTRQMPTTEAGIATRGFSQLYLSLGDRHADGSVVVRIHVKPLVTLIWIGGVVMAAGAALSLADRRLRIGAPMKARRPREVRA